MHRDTILEDPKLSAEVLKEIIMNFVIVKTNYEPNFTR